MPPLPPPPSSQDWPDEILAVARQQFNCVIDVIDPTRVVDEPYDPITDTGGTSAPLVVIADRPARVQHIRLPLEQSGASEWGTKRRYRVQCEILTGDALIRKGFMVRVRGGRDPVLSRFALQVLSASNSSHAALRTIETITEYGAVPE